MQVPVLESTIQPITQRSLAHLDADISAAKALAQATVNVELFTIPLYMGTMYSIHGMHQINASGQNYYLGREWPGMSTRAMPGTPNAQAFNIIFSVFIQEMLHLQMAANIATALGVQPSFTSLALQTDQHGWHCYAENCSIIPHIVDLKDTIKYQQVRVNVEALNDNQVKLFLAIEQPESDARKQLQHLTAPKYFPAVPFKDWQACDTELDLPLFGTIGWMYECYAQYLSIEYTDGESLFHKMFQPGAIQKDLFHTTQPAPIEFPGFQALLTPEDISNPTTAFDKVIDMMSAISDQGEGNSITLQRYRKRHLLTAVDGKYQENTDALKYYYPSYDQKGDVAPSSDAAARGDSKALDHYERFQKVGKLLPEVTTWTQWHAAWDKEHRGWTGADLHNADYDPAKAPPSVPKPEDVAQALNKLKAQGAATHHMLSQVAVGAIAGITTVLDKYWQGKVKDFPFPSMAGSGDRMSICWAIFGLSADLSVGLDAPDTGKLYHACQGLSLAEPDTAASCAAIEIYHSCKGSNSCHAQGGCGFAHSDEGGGGGGCSSASCGGKVAAPKLQGTCGAPGTALFSAPSDNKCASFGGCAVPISASQLYPVTETPPTMKLYDFVGPDHQARQLDSTMAFACGDSVYEKAWEAYKAVMASRGQPVGTPMPKPTDLRLALPPST